MVNVKYLWTDIASSKKNCTEKKRMKTIPLFYDILFSKKSSILHFLNLIRIASYKFNRISKKIKQRISNYTIQTLKLFLNIVFSKHKNLYLISTLCSQ